MGRFWVHVPGASEQARNVGAYDPGQVVARIDYSIESLLGMLTLSRSLSLIKEINT